MDQNELEEPQDDDVVEITNLNQDDEAGSSNTPRFFMETWLLSPKYRKQKTIATAICMGLAQFTTRSAYADLACCSICAAAVPYLCASVFRECYLPVPQCRAEPGGHYQRLH
jgi:hypothetical protein